MEKFNCEDHQNNKHQIIMSLVKEINYKNHKLMELEHNYDDTKALFRKVVISLTQAINSKENNLMTMEQKYHESSVTNRHLECEKDMLMKQYSTGNFL